MIMGITWTHLDSVWNPSGPSEVPLLHKPVTGQELFFVVSYSKPALDSWQNILNLQFPQIMNTPCLQCDQKAIMTPSLH